MTDSNPVSIHVPPPSEATLCFDSSLRTRKRKRDFEPLRPAKRRKVGFQNKDGDVTSYADPTELRRWGIIDPVTGTPLCFKQIASGAYGYVFSSPRSRYVFKRIPLIGPRNSSKHEWGLRLLNELSILEFLRVNYPGEKTLVSYLGFIRPKDFYSFNRNGVYLVFEKLKTDLFCVLKKSPGANVNRSLGVNSNVRQCGVARGGRQRSNRRLFGPALANAAKCVLNGKLPPGKGFGVSSSSSSSCSGGGCESVRSIMFQIFRGLAILHSRGIVHRDVKPSNVLCDAKVLQQCCGLVDDCPETTSPRPRRRRNRRRRGGGRGRGRGFGSFENETDDVHLDRHVAPPPPPGVPHHRTFRHQQLSSAEDRSTPSPLGVSSSLPALSAAVSASTKALARSHTHHQHSSLSKSSSSSQSPRVCLCDFGLATSLASLASLRWCPDAYYVCTRWYRPPELISVCMLPPDDAERMLRTEAVAMDVRHHHHLDVDDVELDIHNEMDDLDDLDLMLTDEEEEEGEHLLDVDTAVKRTRRSTSTSSSSRRGRRSSSRRSIVKKKSEKIKRMRMGTKMDLFAAGCVMWELMTGNPLFPGKTTVEVAEMHRLYYSGPLRSRFQQKSSSSVMNRNRILGHGTGVGVVRNDVVDAATNPQMPAMGLELGFEDIESLQSLQSLQQPTRSKHSTFVRSASSREAAKECGIAGMRRRTRGSRRVVSRQSPSSTRELFCACSSERKLKKPKASVSDAAIPPPILIPGRGELTPSPDYDELSDFGLQSSCTINQPSTSSVSLSSVAPGTSLHDLAFHVIHWLLSRRPEDRPTAVQAMQHPFFAGIRRPRREVPLWGLDEEIEDIEDDFRIDEELFGDPAKTMEYREDFSGLTLHAIREKLWEMVGPPTLPTEMSDN